MIVQLDIKTWSQSKQTRSYLLSNPHDVSLVGIMHTFLRGHDMHHGVICAEMEGEVYDYISREPSRYMEYDEDGFSHTFRGAFRYGNQRSGGWIHFDLGENIRIRRNSEMLIRMVYLNPISSQVQLSSVKSMYNALRVREKDELIHLLQY